MTMNRRDDHHRPRRPDGREIARREDRLVDELSRRIDGPDLTDSIMGKLGYVRASSADQRRRRIRRWTSRLMVTAALLSAIGVGLHMREQGSQVRHAEGITVSEALNSDAQQVQQRLDRTFRLIRNLAPVSTEPVEQEEPDEPIDADVDQSAVGPFRWL